MKEFLVQLYPKCDSCNSYDLGYTSKYGFDVGMDFRGLAKTIVKLMKRKCRFCKEFGFTVEAEISIDASKPEEFIEVSLDLTDLK